MWTLYSLICFIILYFPLSYGEPNLEAIFNAASEATLSEDGKLNFTELAKKYGHPAEEHDVVTEDGYILTVFCIPGNKPPVLLFHGLLDSADSFIIRGEISHAIVLAEAGYMVCAGNNRGNKYGRRHKHLNPDKDKKFWDFSFHEIGYYDLAATIDFIKDKTGENVSIISMSQGFTASMVLASTRPEYNDRIKVCIGMAPMVFLYNLGLGLTAVTLAGPAINALIPGNFQEVLENHSAASNLVKFICSKGLISYDVCFILAVFPFTGGDTNGFGPEFTSTVIGHFPAASSRKNLVHFDQVAIRKSFSQYDYGIIENMAKYGSVSPPKYNLNAVTMDVALFVGSNDQISTVKDVKNLAETLPSVVEYTVMEPKEWAHLDFMWNARNPQYLFPKLLKILDEHC